MVSDYVNQIKEIFEANRNPENAQAMKKYMRNLFDCIGLKNPERTELTKGLLQKNLLPSKKDAFKIVRELWNMQEREYQYFAMNLLDKFAKQPEEEDIIFYEWLITEKSWWDTVDWIAAHYTGNYFKKFPGKINTVTSRWIESDNIWLKRSALLFQLKYKTETDLDLLFSYINKCLGSKEFFINKAIGWILREYSKTDPARVIEFVEKTRLAPLSRKEALKVIDRKRER
jgi:3-methyladenine DNA glycosylase AlkD